MKKLMHMLFLSCLKASQLIEKKTRIKLSAREKIQLKIHKAMCQACKLYEDQSEIIDKGIEKSIKNGNLKIDNTSLKEKILKKIENTSL